jgi:hypothetical protein
VSTWIIWGDTRIIWGDTRIIWGGYTPPQPYRNIRVNKALNRAEVTVPNCFNFEIIGEALVNKKSRFMFIK